MSFTAIFLSAVTQAQRLIVKQDHYVQDNDFLFPYDCAESKILMLSEEMRAIACPIRGMLENNSTLETCTRYCAVPNKEGTED